MDNHPSKKILIRPPSCDTDILAILSNKLLLNKITRTLCITSMEMKKSMLGFHAFIGNDYMSSFLKRGEGSLLTPLLCYHHIFTWLILGFTKGNGRRPWENVCSLYGSKKRVHSVSSEMSENTSTKEWWSIASSTLPIEGLWQKQFLLDDGNSFNGLSSTLICVMN